MKLSDLIFKLPFVDIIFKPKQDEMEYAIQLIDFLEGKRVLFNDCMHGCKNCKERSKKSVLKIKTFTTNMLDKLPIETNFKQVVRIIRQESNNFLNDIAFEESYAKIIYARDKSFCPILKYRKKMAECILNIMDMYDIREIGDLANLIQEYIKYY